MPVDHEGNAIAVGYTGYLPFTVTDVLDNGTLVISSGYSNVIDYGIPAGDVHKGQPPTWPALPA